MAVALAERIQQVMDEATLEKERDFRYGFSNAHGCRRQAVYTGREFQETGEAGITRKPLRWRLTAACGHAIASELEAAALRLGDSTQVAAGLSGALDVKGTSDWIWLDGEYAIDFKVKGEWAWRQIQREPEPDEVQQVASYAVALGLKRWGLCYIRGMSCFGKGEGVETVIHEGPALEAHADATRAFWGEVHEHLTGGTLPERGYPQDSIQCQKFCRFTQTCWGSA